MEGESLVRRSSERSRISYPKKTNSKDYYSKYGEGYGEEENSRNFYRKTERSRKGRTLNENHKKNTYIHNKDGFRRKHYTDSNIGKTGTSPIESSVIVVTAKTDQGTSTGATTTTTTK